jgi:putative heme-binding domain-containing protein
MSTSVSVKEDLDTEMLEVNDKYGESLKNMLLNQPDAQALHYALILREMKKHWDDKNAKAYFNWLHQAEQKNGGRSYKGFIKMIRKDALRYQTNEIKAYVEQLSKNVAPREMVTAKGPGRLWTLEQASKALEGAQHADINNGKKMFKAAMCAMCHTFSGEGGSAGPDLTQLGNRFSKKDIIDATINPSSAIAEQYQLYEVLLKSEEMLTGKLMADEKGYLEIATNFLDTSMTKKVSKTDVVSITPSSVSAMPPGLINALNPQELNDLMAFLTSAK